MWSFSLTWVEASFWAMWVERSRGQASRGCLVGGEGALPKGCPVRQGSAGLGFAFPGEILEPVSDTPADLDLVQTLTKSARAVAVSLAF